ncbi:hypothetical protein PILCRDRAFT_654376 [Piloderma croceum F 1598]|uniref:Uncharacterized protein n=1 Tax=Piloderma croceum (strain F 1598) TaxID=765440 RepID=A0A0C3BFX3_PILCF|nr:hypothetical protein PILCRDRAFT_654376 [Piloderma croceum F 1598]
MGFGRLAASKIEPDVEIVSPVAQPINNVKKAIAAAVNPTPPSTSESFRKYLRAEGKKMTMCAIKGEPFPGLPDTPPRFKKSIANIVPTPFVSLSSSGSLRKYLREEGKKIAMHALSGEPYLDTPPRFKKRMVGSVIPSFAEDPFLATNPEAFGNLADSRQVSSSLSYPAAKDVFGPGTSPIHTDLLAAEGDFVIIDPTLSKVFNLPRTSSICRVVNTVKSLSRRGSNKENVTSSTPTPTKVSRTSISSFAPNRLLSRKKSHPWR